MPSAVKERRQVLLLGYPRWLAATRWRLERVVESCVVGAGLLLVLGVW